MERTTRHGEAQPQVSAWKELNPANSHMGELGMDPPPVETPGKATTLLAACAEAALSKTEMVTLPDATLFGPFVMQQELTHTIFSSRKTIQIIPLTERQTLGASTRSLKATLTHTHTHTQQHPLR